MSNNYQEKAERYLAMAEAAAGVGVDSYYMLEDGEIALGCHAMVYLELAREYEKKSYQDTPYDDEVVSDNETVVRGTPGPLDGAVGFRAL